MLHEAIRSELLKWRGVDESRNRYGTKRAYFRDGREFAHFHSEWQLDVRTRGEENGVTVVANPFTGEWLLVNFFDEKDVEHALKLLRKAYEDAGK